MQIFDSHLHIINPTFPLIPNDGYLPPNFTVEDYITATKKIPVTGGAVVSGSFQGFDQYYLVDALQKLGRNYVGVTQVPHTITDEELNHLNEHGVKAIRFNIKRGGSENIGKLEEMAKRVYGLFRWHVELYLDSKDLAELKYRLVKLPLFSIDHLGLTDTGHFHLFYLVENGCRVKATGFGRINFDPIPVIKKIFEINPQALMFGTDLPSTRAKRPFEESDIKIITDNFSESDAGKILYNNAFVWYIK